MKKSEEKPVAIVTGAARGIGRAIALALNNIGFDIAGVDILFSPQKKKSFNFYSSSKLKDESKFLPIRADISDLHKHSEIISMVMKTYGRLDLLVNNAGVAPEKRTDVLKTSPQSFDRVLAVNLRGTFFLTQKIAQKMLKLKKIIPEYHQKIIFITSISSEISSPNRAEYCISKAGLNMASKIFADRLSGSGINVYEIRPGIIQTEMTAPVKEKYDKLIADGLIPQNRWGVPEDVAKVVVAIAGGAFDYSTGMVFEVSGGMNIRSL